MEDAEVLKAVLSHQHTFLGFPSRVWHFAPDGQELPYQILKFPDTPLQDAATFSTLGLSLIPCRQTGGVGESQDMRLELIISAYSRIEDWAVIRIMMAFADTIARQRIAPYNGEVINWGQPIRSDNPQFRHLFCTHPLLFEDGFARLDSIFPPTIFVALYPITQEEASYATDYGLKLSEKFIEERVDLLAFDERTSLPLSWHRCHPRRAE